MTDQRSWLCAGSLALALCGASRASAQGVASQPDGPSSVSAPAETMPTDAPPTKEQCVASHKQTQLDIDNGRLLSARGQAAMCTSQACPGPLVSDCGRWLTDLSRTIPSMVFEVRLDGATNLDADIYVDGQLVRQWTRGEALQVDPGEHTVRFVLDPYPPRTETVVVAERMKFRVVSADFESAAAASPPPDTTPVPSAPGTRPARERGDVRRPVPVIVYPLLGVAGLGAVGFTAFGLTGLAEESSLDQQCAPDCGDDAVSGVRRDYLYADISLGVGVAGLISATVFYLTRPERPVEPTVGFSVLPGGVPAVWATGRF